MLQLETVSLLDRFIELIEQDLPYGHGEVVIDKGFDLRVSEELLYGRPGAVKLVLEVVVADGVGVIMAHNEVSLGGCDQLSIRSSLQFGVGGAFAGSGVLLDEFFNSLSQPKLVYEVDVKPVAEMLFH